MVMAEGNWPDLLEPVLRRTFDVAVSRPRAVMDQLFGLETSTRFQERYLGIGATGLVPVFDGTVVYDDFDAGYRTDIQNVEFALGMQVERALVDDDMTGEIARRAANIGESFGRTVESDAADIFINAFTDSGTARTGASTNGADGVALLSTAHPRSPVDSGNTQSNEATLDLNVSNVDTTRQRMLNFTDDRGELVEGNPNTILIPTELERTATQIFGRQAVWEPGSAQFDANMFAGKFNVIVWNRLTDANAWFMIDFELMKRELLFQWRIRPEFAREGDFDGLKQKYRGYMRYGIGWIGWKWIYGNNPS